MDPLAVRFDWATAAAAMADAAEAELSGAADQGVAEEWPSTCKCSSVLTVVTMVGGIKLFAIMVDLGADELRG